MPFRQTIGISLAVLMASTGAFANAPQKSASYHPAAAPNAEPGKSQSRSGKTRLSQRKAHSRLFTFNRTQRTWRDQLAAAGVTSADQDASSNPTLVTEAPQIGRAAWYDLVGDRTSSGERLDTVTPTAAHRSLPLGSSARVTDLDTGQSVIVRINDRGPYNRRFIIDLSPRAADELGMRHAGVAAVAVEPVALAPARGDASSPTDAVYRDANARLSR